VSIVLPPMLPAPALGFIAGGISLPPLKVG
jgi:hypothetical protein